MILSFRLRLRLKLTSAFKGEDRHDTDGSLSLGLGRLQDGWTSPSVSACYSASRRSAGLRSLSPSLPLALAS